jgi:hypothetical protein
MVLVLPAEPEKINFPVKLYLARLLFSQAGLSFALTPYA